MLQICESCKMSFEHHALKRFCSRSCANKRIRTLETKKKISEALIKFRPIEKLCSHCNSIFIGTKQKFCSRKCSSKYNMSKQEVRNKISVSVTGKTGGWRNFGGNGLKGKYEGYLYQSSWELAWLIYHIDHSIKFRRCDEFFEYEYEKKKSKYYPDFFLEAEQCYIEIKGFMSKRTKAKIASVPASIKVLQHKEMKRILSYARAKMHALKVVESRLSYNSL